MLTKTRWGWTESRGRFLSALRLPCFVAFLSFGLTQMTAVGQPSPAWLPLYPTTNEAAEPDESTPVPASQPAEPDESNPAPASQPAELDEGTPAPALQPAEPDDGTPAPASQPAEPPAPEPRLRPRFELHVPSLRHLFHEAQRSNAGFLLQTVGSMIVEAGRSSSQQVDVDQAIQLLRPMEDWPDTPVDLAVYAPNREGRPRWAVRIQWPAGELRDRMAALIASEAAQQLLKDVVLTSGPADGYTISLPELTLAYLLPAGPTASLLTTFDDVEFPDPAFAGTAQTHEDGEPLLVCRLNLTQTEKDSGATFFSSISFVTDVVYAARVNPDGNWIETVHVHWPPITGLGAKSVFDKVKQTFFVPDEAFASMVANSLASSSILEQAAGVEGESPFVPGPVAESIRPEVCITALPGTGFFPVPDVVFQVRLRSSPESFLKSVGQAISRQNQRCRDHDEEPPWHRETVDDRVVFWRESESWLGGGITFQMRTVLFLTTETDAAGQQRNILVVGSTSTSPERLIRRWLNFPRHQARRFLPSRTGTRGQAWVNWKQVYRHAAPYLNVTISSVTRSSLLPDFEEVSRRLTDGMLTAQMQYTGLEIRHDGPVPAGVVVVPALAAASLAETSGGTDLARERDATRKLRVLYHHARLFRKDVGRWPAEVRELDGYVDFAGNPYLLRVELSSRQTWRAFARDLFASGEADRQPDEDDEDDLFSGIDDSIYVIEWGRESWRLGFAPGTFDHLEKLFIDENGQIHRVEKPARAATSQPAETQG